MSPSVSPPGDLGGLGFVITRPRAAAEALAAELAAAGARPIVFPAIEIVEEPPGAALETALETLPGARFAIFVSAHAVTWGLAAVRRRGPFPATARVAAVGEFTASALRAEGFERVLVPEDGNDSEALLGCSELREVSGTPIIVFRGVGGREMLRETLEARGASVVYAECYRRRRARTDPRPLLEAWRRGEVHAVGALSRETLEHFLALIGDEGRERLSATALVVAHPAVATHPEAGRFGRVLVSGPGTAALVAALGSLRKTR